MGVPTVTDRDGSFRRLIELVREDQEVPIVRLGRPRKNRVSTTGLFAANIHERMKAVAKDRTARAGRFVSTSDVYNEAAVQLIEDLHFLLGDELRLPAGAVTLAGILGLREMMDRPVETPLHVLDFQWSDQSRTTIYFDQIVWDALIEMTLRFGLMMRRVFHVHRLIELSAAWYLAGLNVPISES